LGIEKVNMPCVGGKDGMSTLIKIQIRVWTKRKIDVMHGICDGSIPSTCTLLLPPLEIPPVDHLHELCSPIDLFHTTFAPSAEFWLELMNRICVQASVLFNRSLEFLWKYIIAIHLRRALILDYLRSSLDADVEMINRWRQTQSQGSRFLLFYVHNKEAVTSLIVLFLCPDWVLNRYQQNCVGGHFIDNEVDHFRR